MMVITLVFCKVVIKVHDKTFIQPTDSLLALILELEVYESLNVETMGSIFCLYVLTSSWILVHKVTSH